MSADFDYIVVGSGAGGGPLAANLAKAGFTVLLMEAGGDSCSECETGRLMYEVPIFHGLSTEYKACAWDFFVRHYSEDAQQERDSKYVRERGGVFYPRAGTLGGCTAHNAMITVVPQDSDWNHIAQITGDESWDAEKMRQYFTRLENCTYVPRPGSIKEKAEEFVSTIASWFKGGEEWREPAGEGHGFGGWLTTSEADPRLTLKDPEIVAALLDAAKEALIRHVGNPLLRVETRFDPNDSRNAAHSPEGFAFTPLAVDKGKRNGPREYVRRVQKEHPGNLTLQMHSLATRVLFEGKRAIGVEFLEGPHQYKADPMADGAAATKRQVTAKREVILCGGAFNSPQLLMLSGVGPAAHLKKFDIPILVDLPGVGSNLQDRYEVGIVSEFTRDFALLQGATFALPDANTPDPYFVEWESGKGIYASNGALAGIIKRSQAAKPDPDLYIFALPGYFKGYFPGYSTQFERYRDRMTWAILKARTNNTGGSVCLRSADPRDTPDIQFRYFNEGNDASGDDLESVVGAVSFVREMNHRLASLGFIKQELVPGPQYDTPDKIREFIRNEAWGHHASCTNPIGAAGDRMAVLDSRFRVRGTTGLRVVDASVFPRIPGYFIVSAVYMISEKAADAIAEDAQTTTHGASG